MKLTIVIPAAIGLILIVEALFTDQSPVIAKPSGQMAQPVISTQARVEEPGLWNSSSEDEPDVAEEFEASAEFDSLPEAEFEQAQNEDQRETSRLPIEAPSAPLPSPQLSVAGPAIHYPDPPRLER